MNDTNGTGIETIYQRSTQYGFMAVAVDKPANMLFFASHSAVYRTPTGSVFAPESVGLNDIGFDLETSQISGMDVISGIVYLAVLTENGETSAICSFPFDTPSSVISQTTSDGIIDVVTDIMIKNGNIYLADTLYQEITQLEGLDIRYSIDNPASVHLLFENLNPPNDIFERPCHFAVSGASNIAVIDEHL